MIFCDLKRLQSNRNGFRERQIETNGPVRSLWSGSPEFVFFDFWVSEMTRIWALVVIEFGERPIYSEDYSI